MRIITTIKERLQCLHALFANRRYLKGMPLDLKSKNLIIHVDDLGFHSSVNRAFFLAYDNGLIKSGSIMVPCSGFDEMADFAMRHLDLDLGIHLTITSEWPNYKWGPISPLNYVNSIIDSDGYFFSNKKELLKKFKPSEVEYEFESQIKTVLDRGIKLTHIDSHMFVALSHPTIQKIYMKLGRKYNLPVLIGLNKPFYFWKFQKKLVMNKIVIANSHQSVNSLRQFYGYQLNSITKGLNILLIHPAINEPELSNLIGSETAFGSKWRQMDFEYFTSNEFKHLIQEMNIKLISWTDITIIP